MPQTNGKFTILVVDDDPTVRMAVTNLLRSKGFGTLKASNGQECLVVTQEKKPDLLLLDINMPQMDGVEACRQLKENAETSGIPVIFMTSLGNDADRVKGFEVGGEDYVIKPVNYQELLARMKRFMDKDDTPAQVPTELISSIRSCGELVEELASATELPEQLSDLVDRLKQELEVARGISID